MLSLDHLVDWAYQKGMNKRKRPVRMSDACSALPLLNPHFLFYFLSRYSLSIDFYHPKCSLILQIQALLFCVHAKTKCTRKSRFLVNLCSSFFLSLCPFQLSFFPLSLSVGPLTSQGYINHAFSFSPSFISGFVYKSFPLSYSCARRSIPAHAALFLLISPLIFPALREITIFVHLSEVRPAPFCLWYYVASFPSFFLSFPCPSFSNHPSFVLFSLLQTCDH